ncbi:MAG: hypothetical protein JW706_07820 [Opitutales bacterium]|nr:hypothetical protein [Opitutales bacterium]
MLLPNNHSRTRIARISRFLTLILAGIVVSTSIQAKNRELIGSETALVKIKPDLRFVSFRAERTGIDADDTHQMLLTASITNTGRACGSFVLRIEKSGRIGPWTRVAEVTIDGIEGRKPDAMRLPSAIRTFDDIVPHGSIVYYRATVDSLDTIDEAREDNNYAGSYYDASGCLGVDLELSRIQMERVRSGIAFRVWIRNRCLADCNGEIAYSVTPISPPGTSISQSMGISIPGEATIGPSGTMLVPGSAGTDLVYQVTIGASGTCRESSEANNTYRVTLNADEEEKTVECRYWYDPGT